MNIKFENLGTVNKNKVQVGDFTFWFSYWTCVAFDSPKTGLVVRHNDWSTTTGKLIASLADKDNRIDGKSFEKMLDKIKITIK